MDKFEWQGSAGDGWFGETSFAAEKAGKVVWVAFNSGVESGGLEE